jgi:transposase-like protein
MAHRHQPKRFDARLNMNVPAELRAELDAAAKQSGELISDVARRVLVDWATARVVDRGGPAANGHDQHNRAEQRT